MFFIKDRPMCDEFKRPFSMAGVTVYKYKPDKLFDAPKFVYLPESKNIFHRNILFYL